MQVLIPNALQPAEVEEVILCQMLGRAIVLVREDQLSLAIGRRGQNVRLASKLCGWDIEIMTREELDEQIEQAVVGFSSLEGVESELAEKLVGEGFLSYDDLSVIEPDALMEMGGLTAEQVDKIVAQAEVKAAEAEKAAAEQRRKQRSPGPPGSGRRSRGRRGSQKGERRGGPAGRSRRRGQFARRREPVRLPTRPASPPAKPARPTLCRRRAWPTNRLRPVATAMDSRATKKAARRRSVSNLAHCGERPAPRM